MLHIIDVEHKYAFNTNKRQWGHYVFGSSIQPSVVHLLTPTSHDVLKRAISVKHAPEVIISTLRWAVLTVLCIGFCHTGPISLCIDLFLFIHVYFVCFCCIFVVLLWARWRRLGEIKAEYIVPYLPSVLWHCWLGHLISYLTYNVFGGQF